MTLDVEHTTCTTGFKGCEIWGRFHAFVKEPAIKPKMTFLPTLLQSLPCSLLCSQMPCKPPSIPVRNALQDKRHCPKRRLMFSL